MTKRGWMMALVAGVLSVSVASPAFACGGLIGPNGAVRLVRTTTLAAWHAGIEHYVTSFQFEGSGAQFGSIVPLPGNPTKIEKGGGWTLQRLEREVQPPIRFATAGAAASSGDAAVVVQQTKIDALELTVLRGGGVAVGTWAKQNGFLLTPDAPELLDYYARQSQYFLAARFDAASARARGQQSGDGTPIQLTIPLAAPWVPLRILGLGLQPTDQIQADVFLLTDKHPKLHAPEVGVEVRSSDEASSTLLNDLRADKNMDWVPQQGWLTFLSVDGQTRQIKSDLTVDPQPAPRPAPPVTAPPATGSTTTTSTSTTTTVAPKLVADPSPLTPLRAAHHQSTAWILVLVAVLLLGAVAASAGRLARRRDRSEQ